MSFDVNQDWSNRWIQDVDLVSIRIDTVGHWFENDMGLGIIERLGRLPRPQFVPRTTEIGVRTSQNQDDSNFASPLDPGLGNYQKDVMIDIDAGDADAPPMAWQIPSGESVSGFILIAELLSTSPPYIPSQTQPPGFSAVPAPRMHYLWWVKYPVLIAALIVGALLSFLWDWSSRDTGWMVFLGIAQLVVAAFAVGMGRDRLSEIRAGLNRITGRLDRKWISPDHHFIRIEGMPFTVGSFRHRHLSEGDSVVITYWPDDKRVDSVEVMTQ